jgi:hypothetical protein
MHKKFWSENLKKRDHLGDLSVDGDIKMNLRNKGCESVSWIKLAQKRIQPQTTMNTEMNHWVPQK